MCRGVRLSVQWSSLTTSSEELIVKRETSKETEKRERERERDTARRVFCQQFPFLRVELLLFDRLLFFICLFVSECLFLRWPQLAPSSRLSH